MVLDTTAGTVQKGYEENEGQHQRGVCKSNQTAVECGGNGDVSQS